MFRVVPRSKIRRYGTHSIAKYLVCDQVIIVIVWYNIIINLQIKVMLHMPLQGFNYRLRISDEGLSRPLWVQMSLVAKSFIPILG